MSQAGVGSIPGHCRYELSLPRFLCYLLPFSPNPSSEPVSVRFHCNLRQEDHKIRIKTCTFQATTVVGGWVWVVHLKELSNPSLLLLDYRIGNRLFSQYSHLLSPKSVPCICYTGGFEIQICTQGFSSIFCS